MAGLLQGSMQQPQQQPQGQPAQGQPGRPPQQGQPPQPGAQGQQAQGREAEQQMYNAVVEAMLGYLYQDGMGSTEKILNQYPNPVNAMSVAIANLMGAVIGSLQKQGKTIPPHVLAQAGMEVAEKIGELAEQMGMIEQDDALAIEMAYFIALDKLGKNLPEGVPGAQEFQLMAKELMAARLSDISPEELPPEMREAMQKQAQQGGQQQAGQQRPRQQGGRQGPQQQPQQRQAPQQADPRQRGGA